MYDKIETRPSLFLFIVLFLLSLLASISCQSDADQPKNEVSSEDDNYLAGRSDLKAEKIALNAKTEEDEDDFAGSDLKTEEDEEEEDDGAKSKHYHHRLMELLILRDADPFCVLATNEANGCLVCAEEDLTPGLNGAQNYNEDCDPTAMSPTDPKEKRCKIYINSTEGPYNPDRSKACLKPTHFLCDPTTSKCACGLEGVIVPEIRFQVGTYDGKNKEGRCFTRPTFDYMPGVECSPGTMKKEISVEEEADSIPICACENDQEFEKFDSSDPDWWRCSRASIRMGLVWCMIFLGVLPVLV